MKVNFSGTTNYVKQLCFVTPDLIGGLCLRLPWIPAFAGMTVRRGMTVGNVYENERTIQTTPLSFPRRRESMQNRRHSRAGGNPCKTAVIPAQAGIYATPPSFPRRRESMQNRRHSRVGGNPCKTAVIPAQAGIHATPLSFPRRRESMTCQVLTSTWWCSSWTTVGRPKISSSTATRLLETL